MPRILSVLAVALGVVVTVAMAAATTPTTPTTSTSTSTSATSTAAATSSPTTHYTTTTTHPTSTRHTVPTPAGAAPELSVRQVLGGASQNLGGLVSSVVWSPRDARDVVLVDGRGRVWVSNDGGASFPEQRASLPANLRDARVYVASSQGHAVVLVDSLSTERFWYRNGASNEFADITDRLSEDNALLLHVIDTLSSAHGGGGGGGGDGTTDDDESGSANSTTTTTSAPSPTPTLPPPRNVIDKPHVRAWSVHPNDANAVAGLGREHELYVSFDGGATFLVTPTNELTVSDMEWANDHTTLFVTARPAGASSSSLFALVRPTDSTTTAELRLVLREHVAFALSHHSYVYAFRHGHGVYVATDRGTNQVFRRCRFAGLTDDDWSSMSSAQVDYVTPGSASVAPLLAVQRTPSAADPNPTAKLYQASANGIEYTVLLDDVSYDDGYADVTAVAGLHGVVFANRGGDRLRTEVSRNNGGSFVPLEAPEYNSENERLLCWGHCALHLNSFNTWFDDPDAALGPLWAHAGAPGVLIGTGAVGDHLSSNPVDTHTYMSWDAGDTFAEVLPYASIYEFGASGSLILVAREGAAVDELTFSVSGGEQWHTLRLPRAGFRVDNIRTDDAATATSFLVYGTHAGDADAGDVTVYHVAATEHTRTCVADDWHLVPIQGGTALPKTTLRWLEHHGRASSSGGGIATANHTTHDCLLGAKRRVWMKRRSPAHWCVGRPASLVDEETPCACDEYDYECAYGYVRGDDFTCEPLTGSPVLLENLPRHCPAGSSFVAPSQYLKIAGDVCTGDVYPTHNVSCPPLVTPPSVPTVLGHPLWVVVVVGTLIAIGVVVSIGVLVVIGRSSLCKDCLGRRLAPAEYQYAYLDPSRDFDDDDDDDDDGGMLGVPDAIRDQHELDDEEEMNNPALDDL